jgi:hypothetical protein
MGVCRLWLWIPDILANRIVPVAQYLEAPATIGVLRR